MWIAILFLGLLDGESIVWDEIDAIDRLKEQFDCIKPTQYSRAFFSKKLWFLPLPLKNKVIKKSMC